MTKDFPIVSPEKGMMIIFIKYCPVSDLNGCFLLAKAS